MGHDVGIISLSDPVTSVILFILFILSKNLRSARPNRIDAGEAQA